MLSRMAPRQIARAFFLQAALTSAYLPWRNAGILIVMYPESESESESGSRAEEALCAGPTGLRYACVPMR
jgi:hypothetical protein